MSFEERVQEFLEMAGVTLIKPSDVNLIGCCPFHSDTHRSFSMNTETGQWCCFAESCGEQGGLFSFLVKGCGYSIDKAKTIAEEWTTYTPGAGTEAGWDVDFPTWEERRKSPDKQDPIPEKLLGLYDFCPKYMRRRGFSKETLHRWEIGYDFETERVTFPVRDERGDLIGISKRTIRGEDPKYLHLGFKRSRLLYGEFFLPRESCPMVVEGQTDALAIHQMGYGSPVSTMSANVGPRQIRRLRRYPSVVLAFDDDEDGRAGATKVGDGLIELGHREVYVARSYPKGINDPAQLLQEGSEKDQRKFLSRIEPYDCVRLEWS